MILAFLGLLVLIVAAFSGAAFISMKPPRKEPDPQLGLAVGALVLGVILLGLLIFVPKREGAFPNGVYIVGSASLSLIAWGFAQISFVRRKAKRRARHRDSSKT